MTTLLQLIEKSGLNRNQISKISGISNTYLNKIGNVETNGVRSSIRRKTLINIAISLNLSLVEINDLLEEYGHEELSTSDTPSFLSVSENQTVKGILPVFSSLVIGWFLIGMEKTLSITEGASLEYVLDQPNHSLKSPEYASFISELNFSSKKIMIVHKNLAESACIHRRKLITEALERGNCITTYICSNCLERYMGGWKKYTGTDIEEKYKMFIREHMQTLIEYIETYPAHFKLKLLKKCPRMRYELLYMPSRTGQENFENKISKVIFLGRESECNKDRGITGGSNDFGLGQGFGNLIGFATDLENLLNFFHRQHLGLNDNFVDSRFNDPKKMIKRIMELMSRSGLKEN